MTIMHIFVKNSTMNKYLITAILILILSACNNQMNNDDNTQNAAESAILLQLKTGETYFMCISTGVDVTSPVKVSPENVYMDIKDEIALTVLKEEDGIYEIGVHFVNRRIIIVGENESYLGDSGDSIPNPFSLMLKNMTQKEFKITMTKAGEILQIINYDNIYSDLFNGLPDIDEQTKTELLQQIKEAQGPESFKESFDYIAAACRNKPVKPGDTWGKKINSGGKVPAVCTLTYKLKKSDENSIEITGSGIIDSDEHKIVFENNREQKFNASGRIKTRVVLNKKTGWIETVSISKQINGTLHLLSNPLMPEEISYPVEFSEETVIRSIIQ